MIPRYLLTDIGDMVGPTPDGDWYKAVDVEADLTRLRAIEAAAREMLLNRGNLGQARLERALERALGEK